MSDRVKLFAASVLDISKYPRYALADEMGRQAENLGRTDDSFDGFGGT
jgi:hypothetical protein